MSQSVPVHTSGGDAFPREVAGLRLLRQVGVGGMSDVFLGYDTEGSRHVAVKLLAEKFSESPELVARFYREARLSRLLFHPNLVQGYQAGYDTVVKKHYLILEYIDGPSAQRVLEFIQRFPVGEAVQIAIDIAKALAFLHSRQYVHRDVKPDNILLHPQGIAKLADLGLAKRLNDDTQLTTVTHGVGTPYYMAYEQALNPALVDGRSDIFALGATLYHLITGQLPFPGANHTEVLRLIRAGHYVPIPTHGLPIPPAVIEIIHATLARDPRIRFQTAEELIAALQATGAARPLSNYSFLVGPNHAASSIDAPTQIEYPPVGS